MKHIFCAVVLGLLVPASHCAPAPGAVVGQLHVISIHVPTHAVFDSVFGLLRDELELPLVYGELSKTGEKPEERHYAGFSAGNAYLEPCGPYTSDAPFIESQMARFHGLTFSPATTLAGAVQELAARHIAHSGVMGSGELPRFLYFSEAPFTGKFQAVSLWEIQDTNNHANLAYVSSLLQRTKGGALGVKRIREVRVGYAGKASRTQWTSFLSPVQPESSVWTVGHGPAMNLVPAAENQIQSIVLEVACFETAKAVLTQKRLLGKATADTLELDPAKTFGLSLLFLQQ